MSGPGQHRGLTALRWSAFTFEQQILAIGNEMHRAAKFLALGETTRARPAYERVLRLTDLTIGLSQSRTRRRELLRWRDLAAGLFLQTSPSPEEHRRVFRALLLITPQSARQIPLLFHSSDPSSSAS